MNGGEVLQQPALRAGQVDIGNCSLWVGHLADSTARKRAGGRSQDNTVLDVLHYYLG
jgi:hypothetical protein